MPHYARLTDGLNKVNVQTVESTNSNGSFTWESLNALGKNHEHQPVLVCNTVRLLINTEHIHLNRRGTTDAIKSMDWPSEFKQQKNDFIWENKAVIPLVSRPNCFHMVRWCPRGLDITNMQHNESSILCYLGQKDKMK